MEWKSRSRSRRKQGIPRTGSRRVGINGRTRSAAVCPEETIETGGAPREILYPEADTIQETISLTFLLTSRRS